MTYVEFRDQRVNALVSVMRSGTYPRVIKTASRRAADFVAQRLPSAGDPLPPVEATAALHSMLRALAAEVTRLAGHYPPWWWMWYLRRWPHAEKLARREVFGYFSTLLFAEIVCRSGQGRAVDCRTSTHDVILEPNDSIVSRIVNVLALIREAEECLIHASHAILGDGFRVSPSGRLVPAEVTDVRADVDLWLARLAAHPYSFWGLGGAPGSGSLLDKINDPKDALVLLSFMRDHPEPLRFPREVLKDAHKSLQEQLPCDVAGLRVSVRFVPRVADSARLLGDLGGQWWPDPAVALLFALAAFFPSVFQSYLTVTSVVRNGYFGVPTDELHRFLGESLDDIAAPFRRTFGALPYQNATELIEKLKSLIGSTERRMFGPMMFEVGDLTLVDLLAASHDIQTLLVHEASGDAANARAAAFEREVQASIDETPWRPAETLRPIIGRELRRNGRALTDVDAIGSFGETLMFVSCKSVVVDHKYGLMNHARARNVWDLVQRDIELMDRLASSMERDGPGENFDFSMYQRIVAVTCTPTPLLLPNHLGTREALPGLARAVSIPELREFMDASQGPRNTFVA